MYLLGIDLGTSALKTVLADEKGTILDQVSETYPIYMDRPGYSEQKPEDWFEALLRTLEKLGRDHDLGQVAALSFSGQMHGLVALDEDDKVLRPAILWNDTRTGQEVAYLNNEIGKEILIEETANIAYAGFTLPKILWMQKHEPELWDRVAYVMLPKDYLAYKLSGVRATDYSDASGMLLLDVKNKKWSDKMLEIGKLEESMLGELFESYEAIGHITEEISEKTGLPTSCRVVIGAGDNAAAAIGTGTIGQGACNISLGTSGTIFISSENFIPIEDSSLHSFCHADGNYHVMGVLLQAASAYDWWVKDILAKDYGEVLPEEDSMDPDRPFFMPYLMGERSPHNDEKVRGAFIGLNRKTSAQAMSLAVMEGVSFALRDCLEIAQKQGIRVTDSNLTGGGAKNALWPQMLADTVNLNIHEGQEQAGPAIGAVVLAGKGAGIYKSLEEGIACFKGETEQVVEPRADFVQYYDARYRQFKKLYPSLKQFYQEKEGE